MNVVFLSPAYPPEMQQYTRGLAEVGANVYGVGDSHPAALPPHLRKYLKDYLQVPRIMDEADVTARVAEWLRGKEVDRIESNWEPLQILAAKLRERFGVPGMSVDTVMGFRDKMLMKERVAAAGLRVPYAFRCRTQNEIREAAERVGYPLIIKPIDGAGSADTYKVRDATELESVLQKTQHVREVSCEEFIEGEEFTFDTVSIEGTPAFMNVAQYLPKPLIARSEEWISPVIITVRDMEQQRLQGGIELGRRVLKALNMGSGFTHMEWFLKPNGEAVFGEIGCRPGGAHLVDQMNVTCDVDLFREWARVACWRSFEGNTRRYYNAGIVFKRALGQGRITRITGMEDYRRRFGRYLVTEALLPVGTHRRDWKKTLLSDGHLILRHPNWDDAFKICMAAATDVTMYAGG
jgi:biotin carboxylase